MSRHTVLVPCTRSGGFFWRLLRVLVFLCVSFAVGAVWREVVFFFLLVVVRECCFFFFLGRYELNDCCTL